MALLFGATACCLLSTELSAATFLIDFGSAATGNETTGNWNNLTSAADRSGSINLKDSNGDTGTVTMTWAFVNNTDSFGMNSSVHTVGSLTNLGQLNVTTASKDVLWSNVNWTLTFAGLDENKLYDFTLFAYRGSPDRTSNYTLEGMTAASVADYAVDTSNQNNGVVASFKNQAPDDFSSFILTLAKGSGGYAYLSSLQITEVPEPSSAALLLGGLSALFLKRRR